jgi:hypothetical protein
MITALGPEWRHRTLLREVNERIFALTQEFAPNPAGDLPMMVFCECGIEGCMTPIEMTTSEYEAARSLGCLERARLVCGFDARPEKWLRLDSRRP